MAQSRIDSLVLTARRALSERRFDDARARYREILQLDPAQPRAWLALSALAQRDDAFREAVSAARSSAQAWRASSSNAFLAEVSMRLLVLGDYQLARELILGADASDPLVLRHSMGLVQYLGLTEAHGEALQLADEAIARLGDPPPSLILARANALRHLGRMQEATDAFEQAIAMDPLHAESHWSLAHHAKSREPGARVPRIRRAIAHIAGDSEDAIYLYYALFKELDDAGEIEWAWKALQTGASLKRRTLRHDAAADDRSHQAVMDLCDSDFVTSRSSALEQPSHVPLFIVGLPRSGTTVVERMLSGHPDVRTAGELNDFPLQMAWEADRFLGEPWSEASLKAIAAIDFEALGNAYLQRTAWRAQGARMLIDKLPGNLLAAGFIHRALPNARIICVRRNKQDSVFSTYKHLFSGAAYPYSYDLEETRAHFRRFDRLVEHWKQVLSPERWLQVDYEQMVNQPEACARRLAAFCGLAYDERMVRIEENRSPSATASSSQIRQPLHARHVDQWKRYARWLDVDAT